MTLATRIDRLEKRDPHHGDPFAHLSDEELEARIAELATWFEAEVARVEAGAPIPDDTTPGEWEKLAALVKRWRAESNQGKSA